ncbi:hypothetical protein NDU88_004297 [Pleurodeles waltl]|uniref:Uncharacterized protein n=1 Tax=Pleurodeles waltl TaxID=8319 RepID=A0AAV7V364_PLEWA|nr:hypothetical protein NDU88_004297 [Pleurodeles waltl]
MDPSGDGLLPTLVALGHVVALVVVWHWRKRRPVPEDGDVYQFRCSSNYRRSAVVCSSVPGALLPPQDVSRLQSLIFSGAAASPPRAHASARAVLLMGSSTPASSAHSASTTRSSALLHHKRLQVRHLRWGDACLLTVRSALRGTTDRRHCTTHVPTCNGKLQPSL